MKIKLSKSQWEMVGQRAGWIKTSGIKSELLEKIKQAAPSVVFQNGIFFVPQAKEKTGRIWYQYLEGEDKIGLYSSDTGSMKSLSIEEALVFLAEDQQSIAGQPKPLAPKTINVAPNKN